MYSIIRHDCNHDVAARGRLSMLTAPWSYRPMRPKARVLVQHCGLPRWLEESDLAGCDFIRDGMDGTSTCCLPCCTVPSALAAAAQLRADSISSCSISNVLYTSIRNDSRGRLSQSYQLHGRTLRGWKGRAERARMSRPLERTPQLGSWSQRNEGIGASSVGPLYCINTL